MQKLYKVMLEAQVRVEHQLFIALPSRSGLLALAGRVPTNRIPVGTIV